MEFSVVVLIHTRTMPVSATGTCDETEEIYSDPGHMQLRGLRKRWARQLAGSQSGNFGTGRELESCPEVEDEIFSMQKKAKSAAFIQVRFQ